jgi:PAS domain S-box-containing protein
MKGREPTREQLLQQVAELRRQLAASQAPPPIAPQADTLRLLLEASGVGSWRLDLVTGELTADARCKQLFGLPPDAASSLDAYVERIAPEERPMLQRHVVEARQRPGDYEAERRVTWSDGSVHWLYLKGRSLHDPQSGPQCLEGIAIDVTDRKQAEDALRQSEERARLLVETTPQIVFRMSPDGVELDCNRRGLEYTGLTPGQGAYHGWLQCVHPDDLFRVIEAATHAANTGEPYELEYRLRRASDGSYRWHLGRAMPVLAADGQIISWFGTLTDIEDLKQAQEVLRQSRDELECEVARRTAELSATIERLHREIAEREQAQRALRELQERSERHQAELAHAGRLNMMGEMAATLAHELNQPLHSITNYARACLMRLAKKPQPDETLAAALEDIGSEANRAAQIIRRVRGFVQKREQHSSLVSLNGLVEEVAQLNRGELEQRRARLELLLCAGMPPVNVDPIQIEQVLMNLVRNGLEAMGDTPPEQRVLTITTLRPEETTLEVQVRDRGRGIAEQDLPRVFEAFFTTKTEGIGMGLAISRSIVEFYGGRLWAAAAAEGGTVFHFRLPTSTPPL